MIPTRHGCQALTVHTCTVRSTTARSTEYGIQSPCSPYSCKSKIIALHGKPKARLKPRHGMSGEVLGIGGSNTDYMHTLHVHPLFPQPSTNIHFTYRVCWQPLLRRGIRHGTGQVEEKGATGEQCVTSPRRSDLRSILYIHTARSTPYLQYDARNGAPAFVA